MSEDETNTEFNPARGCRDRASEIAGRRRRRRDGSLNRMMQNKLNIIDDSVLDHDRYKYRWVNDTPGRVRALTCRDDWDHVELSEVERGLDKVMLDSESDNRIRVLVGKDKNSHPEYSYLMRKRREFVGQDYDEVVQAREQMMEGRVRNAELTEDGDEGVATVAYVPKGDIKIGHAAARRRGPLPRKKP
jgi:hypothetical protein